MKLVKKIFHDSGESEYSFARKLGVSLQSLQYMLGKTGPKQARRGMRLDVLVKLRKVSGLSWSQFGQLLEGEFGED